jgi:hypothetical protein
MVTTRARAAGTAGTGAAGAGTARAEAGAGISGTRAGAASAAEPGPHGSVRCSSRERVDTGSYRGRCGGWGGRGGRWGDWTRDTASSRPPAAGVYGAGAAGATTGCRPPSPSTGEKTRCGDDDDDSDVVYDNVCCVLCAAPRSFIPFIHSHHSHLTFIHLSTPSIPFTGQCPPSLDPKAAAQRRSPAYHTASTHHQAAPQCRPPTHHSPPPECTAAPQCGTTADDSTAAAGTVLTRVVSFRSTVLD